MGFCRSKLKYLAFLRKRCNVNPARGPFHFRAPSAILQRTIRGEFWFYLLKTSTSLEFLGCIIIVPMIIKLPYLHYLIDCEEICQAEEQIHLKLPIMSINEFVQPSVVCMCLIYSLVEICFLNFNRKFLRLQKFSQ